MCVRIQALHVHVYTHLYQSFLFIFHTDPDNGNRTGLQNIGFRLNFDAADTSKKVSVHLFTLKASGLM
jgi:hypothetical protein